METKDSNSLTPKVWHKCFVVVVEIYDYACVVEMFA